MLVKNIPLRIAHAFGGMDGLTFWDYVAQRAPNPAREHVLLVDPLRPAPHALATRALLFAHGLPLEEDVKEERRQADTGDSGRSRDTDSDTGAVLP